MHTTPPATETEKEIENIIRAICISEPHAITWFYSFVDFVMTWDHIIDDDPIDKNRADKVMREVLLDWPLNPWFLKYREILVPVISNCVSAWDFSNKENKKIKAYDFMVEVPATIAFILGGRSAVDQYLPELRRLSMKRMDEDELEDGGKL